MDNCIRNNCIMDNTPWIEKYRPSEFNTIILDDINLIILTNMLKTNLIPNMLFYGPPGTGKTTTIINFINQYQKNNNQCHKELIIHLNASDDRGIDIIRNQIDTFSKNSYLFNKGTKFIILDEVDYMTKNAQILLLHLISNNIKDVRFCLICNYISKLDKSLQNICMSIKFNALPKPLIFNYLNTIVKKENINSIKRIDIENIIHNFKSDIRSMINYIQLCSQDTSRPKILTDTNIDTLIDCFKHKTLLISCKTLDSYIYKYNIDKHVIIIRILNRIIKTHDINDTLIVFIRSILHNNNYYTPEFNKFFISNLTCKSVSLIKQ